MSTRERNGKLIGKILEKTGHKDAVIRTDSEWKLSVYFSEREENGFTVEICLDTVCQGDTMFDPLMRVALKLDSDGTIGEAVPEYYMSRTLFGDEEIYAEGNPDCWNPGLYAKAEELDDRLARLLENIKLQGYLSRGEVIRE